MNKPDPITTDYRGTKIEPGLPVAFNLSGYVRLGTVVELVRNDVKKSEYGWYRHMFELHVRDDNTQKISKIKNPGSFVILPLSSSG